MPVDTLDLAQFFLTDPWQIDPSFFMRAEDDRQKLAVAINFAALAPSILNTQPWRFEFSGETLMLRADRRCLLPQMDPVGRELIISCGAALFNLAIALRAGGREVQIRYLPNSRDPDCLATISLGRMITPSGVDVDLRDAILRRHTHPGHFADIPIAPDSFAALHCNACHNDTFLLFIEDAKKRRRLGALVAEAVETQLEDAAFANELAEWLQHSARRAHDKQSEAARRAGWVAGTTPDGVDEAGESRIRATEIVRRFSRPADVAAHERNLLEKSPVCAAFLTRSDQPRDWIFAGEALQRLLLAITMAGLSAAFVSPPLEVSRLRSKVARVVNGPGHKVPQLLLRFGHPARALLPVSRRPVQQVVAWQ